MVFAAIRRRAGRVPSAGAVGWLGGMLDVAGAVVDPPSPGWVGFDCFAGSGSSKAASLAWKLDFNQLRVGGRQGVLRWQALMRPGGGIVAGLKDREFAEQAIPMVRGLVGSKDRGRGWGRWASTAAVQHGGSGGFPFDPCPLCAFGASDRSAPAVEIPSRSGASRSSSPAIPTSVNRP